MVGEHIHVSSSKSHVSSPVSHIPHLKSHALYLRVLLNSSLDSFRHPRDFFAGWLFDALHFLIVVVAFVLFSNTINSSLQHLISVNDLVAGGSLDSVALASSALKVFIVRAVLLSLSLLVAYLFSYTFFKRLSLQFVSRKRISFGKFFWLNASWTVLWVVFGVVHIYALIPALVPLVQFVFSLSDILGMFFYYVVFLFPLFVYLHCTFFLHLSFVECRSVRGAYMGMFGSVLRIHRLLPSYLFVGIIFLCLSFLVPFLESSSQPVQWALVLSLIISPWLSWIRIYIFLLKKNLVA